MLRRPALFCAFVTASPCLLSTGAVHADIFGRLRFTVHDATDRTYHRSGHHTAAGARADRDLHRMDRDLHSSDRDLYASDRAYHH